MIVTRHCEKRAVICPTRAKHTSALTLVILCHVIGTEFNVVWSSANGQAVVMRFVDCLSRLKG